MKIEIRASATPTTAPTSSAIMSTQPTGNGRGGGIGRREPVAMGRPAPPCARIASDIIRSGSIYRRPSAISLATDPNARLAVDFTAPRLIPAASAISASDSPP